jgi:hypothetical protein
MDSQHEHVTRDEREQYVAPAGEELGTVEKLTAGLGVGYPSCPPRN